MKKLLTIAVAIAAGVAVADSETVAGETEIGMVEVTSSLKDTIVAVPYAELAGGSAICVSNIVKTANLTVGDELYVFGGTRDSWKAWVLTSSGGTNPYLFWQSVGAATIGSDGLPTHGTTGASDATKLVAGSAIWLKRKDTPSAAFKFYVYGQYVQTLTTSVEAGKANLIANPLAEAAAIPGTHQNGDRVQILNAAGNVTSYTYRTAKSGWVYVSDGKGAVLTTLKLEPGQGCWYTPTSTKTLTWRE